jgi:hypothetical protein
MLTTKLLWVALAVFLLNLPFGFWRAGTEKFSRNWFLAVHSPVPLVVALRILSGLGWHLSSVPFLVAAFFGGQFVGGRINHSKASPRASAR